MENIDKITLPWRHNEHDGVSNHQPHDYLLNRLSRRRSKKTSKPRATGLCAGNSPGTGEFPAQMASNAENVSIWWRHHDLIPNHIKTQQLTHCPLGDAEIISKLYFSNSFYELISWVIHENFFRWLLWNPIDDKSILVQVMAWRRQATSHYLSQCWPRSMLSYGVTRPQWVKAWDVYITRGVYHEKSFSHYNYWPFVTESTDDRWFALSKSQ